VRALVMGGNRFIGLHLVHELARRGHDVTVLNSHPVPLPAGVRRLHGNRREPGAIEAVLRDHRDSFDVVFENTAYQLEDLEPTVDLFRGRLRHFVFTSSIAVYIPNGDQTPITEGFPVDGQDTTNVYGRYGAGKVRCENYLLSQCALGDLPVTIVRVGHTCGPNNAVAQREPSFFARLELGRPILLPGDGQPLLNMVHVDDVVGAMVSVLGNSQAVGQVYNVTGPEVTSMLDWVKLIGRIADVEPRIVHLDLDVVRRLPQLVFPWREWEFGSEVFSIDKAQRELGWTPRYGIEAALEDACRWLRGGGRDQFQFDFALEDEILAQVSR